MLQSFVPQKDGVLKDIASKFCNSFYLQEVDVGVQESTGTDNATSAESVSAMPTPAAAAALPLEASSAAVEEAAPVPTPATSPLAPVEEPEPGKVTSPPATPAETAKTEDIQPKQEAASIKIEAVKEEPASETTEEAGLPEPIAEVKTELLPSTAASIEHVKNEEPEAPPPERVIEVPEPEKVEVKTPRRGELLVLVALL